MNCNFSLNHLMNSLLYNCYTGRRRKSHNPESIRFNCRSFAIEIEMEAVEVKPSEAGNITISVSVGAQSGAKEQDRARGDRNMKIIEILRRSSGENK